MLLCSFNLNAMHILQTRHYSQSISWKKIRESFLQHISIKTLHVLQFLYFMPYIILANCTICVISWSQTPNLSSCINVVINKYQSKCQNNTICQTDAHMHQRTLDISKPNENTVDIWWFSPTSVSQYFQ